MPDLLINVDFVSVNYDFREGDNNSSFTVSIKINLLWKINWNSILLKTPLTQKNKQQEDIRKTLAKFSIQKKV